MAGTNYPRSQERHKQLISSIVLKHGAETKSFWKAIRTLSEQEDWWEPPREQPFRPDAFKIDREASTVEIHEAVVTHPPSRNGLLCMGAFWFAMDCESWDVRLFLHRADQVAPTEINLCHWYLEIIRERASRLRLAAVEGAA